MSPGGPQRPLRSERRRIIQRHALSHDQRRKYMRWYGFIDPERTWRARIAIGNASWVHPFWGVFGDPTIVLRYMPSHMARVIKFPERRNEFARLRAEIEEMRKTVSVCAEAV